MSLRRHVPNALTLLRLVTGVMVFIALIVATDAVDRTNWAVAALILFVVSAVTDFFDGWLARRWEVVSAWGAIFDPIADKILVLAAILGLVAAGAPTVGFTLPGAIILLREFAVSSLRETVAGKGMKLPVTLLAKWKTTIQLVALACALSAYLWPAWALIAAVSTVLMWVAAAITLWTGWSYFRVAFAD